MFAGQDASEALDRKFLSKVMKTPLLEREEEERLGRAWIEHSDKRSIDKLVASHLKLVVKMASGFRGYGLPIQDLVQEGSIGLMDAAKKFDPDKGVRFSTYARWWILAAIQDYVMRNSSIVRIGTTPAQKALFFNLRRLRSKISKNLIGPMAQDDRAQIAKILDVPLDAVERMEGLFLGSEQSLNSVVGSDDGDGTELQNFLEDDRPTPEDNVSAIDTSLVRHRSLSKAMSTLDTREREIINQRFLEEEKPTLEEIGKKFGVSKERIRQIESAALKKLKTILSTIPRASGDRLEDLIHA
ncbi:MAG: RNA polymerase factor sigma-32 [Rhodospirillaceae bacterium]